MAIGFLALLTVPISEVRSIGVAGFLVAGTSLLLANTLVPALLAALVRELMLVGCLLVQLWMGIGQNARQTAGGDGAK